MQSGATANAGRPWARARPSFASSQHMAAARTAAAPASESPAAHPGKCTAPGMVMASASAKRRGVAWPSPAIMQPRLSSNSRRAASATEPAGPFQAKAITSSKSPSGRAVICDPHGALGDAIINAAATVVIIRRNPADHRPTTFARHGRQMINQRIGHALAA